MLRFEKSSKNQPATIKMREWDHILTPTFLQALIIAFFIHSIGFLIFQVSPIKIRMSTTVYPPVEVNTDLVSFSGQAVKAHPREQQASYKISEPIRSIPVPPRPFPIILDYDRVIPND